MVNARTRTFRRALVALDTATIVLAMAGAMAIHSLLRQHIEGFKSPPSLQYYLLLAYLTLPMWLGVAAALGLYRQFERFTTARKLVGELVQLHLYGLLGLTLLMYLTQIYMNRSVVALFLLLTFCLMLAGRIGAHSWLRRDHRLGYSQERMLLVTDCPESESIVTRCVAGQSLGPTIVGIVYPAGLRDLPESWAARTIGSTDDIRVALHENAVDCVLVSCARHVVVDIDELLHACDDIGVPLRCHVRFDQASRHTVRVVEEAGLPCITYQLRERSSDALFVKRLIDLLVAAIVLVALLPVMLLISAAIMLTMGRPILVKQVRSGYNGRAFTMFKFRSMVRNADELKPTLQGLNQVDGPAFKIDRDPRITPLGRILRRASLDELPQLYNVLVGRMSLVGPRPLLVDEQQRITGPQRRRLSMKPGMTGLWQVSGRSDLNFEEWMTLDLEYVDNWSLALDLKLLLRTFPAVVTARGAK